MEKKGVVSEEVTGYVCPSRALKLYRLLLPIPRGRLVGGRIGRVQVLQCLLPWNFRCDRSSRPYPLHLHLAQVVARPRSRVPLANPATSPSRPRMSPSGYSPSTPSAPLAPHKQPRAGPRLRRRGVGLPRAG